MKYMIQVRFNGADAVIHALPTDEQTQITAEFPGGPHPSRRTRR
jgi:hypothetical protein